MPGTRRNRGPFNAERQRWNRRLKLGGPACGLILAACITAPRPILAPDIVLSPRDSAVRAYETGRRDALLLHRPRTAVFVAALALPASVVASVTTGEPWAAPVAIGSLSLFGTAWAYRQTHRPIPLAPDSMRARYGLDGDHVWSRYQHGFHDAIEAHRRTEFQRSARSTALIVLLGLTYVVIRPRE